MELFVNFVSAPEPPASARRSRLSDAYTFGVMELAENWRPIRHDNSFDNFVPSRFLVDGWMEIVEGGRGLS